MQRDESRDAARRAMIHSRLAAQLRRCQTRGSRLEWKHAMTNTVSSTIRKNRARDGCRQRRRETETDGGEPPDCLVQFGTEARPQAHSLGFVPVLRFACLA